MAHDIKRNHILLHLNGSTLKVQSDEAFLTLAQFLRNQRGQVGTKVVCAEGDCGACTVLVAQPKADTKTGWDSFRAINSCIVPVFLLDRACIVTVEGLTEGTGPTPLSEVQKKMREFHGGQCGFCTPGMVCSLTQLTEDCSLSGQSISEKKARNYLTGNLCRCTGYEPILQAATHIDLSQWESLTKRYLTPELLQQFSSECSATSQSVVISSEHRTVFIPATLSEALELKSTRPQMRIVAGATDIGVLINKAKAVYSEVLVLNQISQLNKVQTNSDSLWIGSQVTLTEVEKFLGASLPEFKTLLHIFASPQIKNQGTLLGNVLNGSPIGDSIPALMVLDAEIEFQSLRGVRSVPLKNFYKAYKVFDKFDDEIALGLKIPQLSANHRCKFIKVSLRKDLDISAVTFAAVVKVIENQIIEARIAMGGIDPCVIRLPEVENKLIGKAFSEDTFEHAGALAAQLITPISDLRASEQYRRVLTKNLFKKCFHELEAACP